MQVKWDEVVQDVEEEPNLLYLAWGIIANAAHWNMEDPSSLEWRAAAIRWRDRWHDSFTKPEEGESVDLMAAGPLYSEDPYFKIKCLELAVQSQGVANRKDLITDKAKHFEKYIKGEI